MALNAADFENDVAQLANLILAVEAQIYRQSNERWAAASGADYETLYNTPPATPAFIPLGGTITQSEMNNFISAINSVKAAIIAASAPISVVGEAAP